VFLQQIAKAVHIKDAGFAQQEVRDAKERGILHEAFDLQRAMSRGIKRGDYRPRAGAR